MSWHARGLLFENCNCTLVCPGHMHFEQLCTHPRCKGYWAIRIDEGEYESIPLGGVKAVVAFDCPQRMIDGGWVETLLLDRSASAAQREAVETILTGRAGGPWAVLARFVERRADTRTVPIEIVEEAAGNKVSIPGLLEAAISYIRGRNKSEPVLFQNIFNQIHAPTQILATGTTEYDDGTITIHNDRSHGLASRFDWSAG